MPAVALLSGGLDSAVAAGVARSEGYAVHALSFDYGQRHRVELERASRIAASLGAEHRIVRVDLSALGGSALTGALPVPKGCPESPVGRGIPATYVPARNTVFLAVALGWAEVLGAFDIFLGVNALDYSGYPDCRPEFVAAFEALANVATAAAVEGRGRFRIHAPLLRLTKAEIVRKGIHLGLDLALTWSCYDPQGPAGREHPCGACDSCILRRKGFAEAGVEDPATKPPTTERS